MVSKRIAQTILIACILAAGIYSFNYTNYLSKANPVRIVQAVQLFGQDSSALDNRFYGPQTGEKRQGPPPGHGAQGGKRGAGSWWTLLALSGVFVSTATVAYLIDQLFRRLKTRS